MLTEHSINGNRQCKQIDKCTLKQVEKITKMVWVSSCVQFWTGENEESDDNDEVDKFEK